jgi:hypothetical protein
MHLVFFGKSGVTVEQIPVLLLAPAVDGRDE